MLTGYQVKLVQPSKGVSASFSPDDQVQGSYKVTRATHRAVETAQGLIGNPQRDSNGYS